MTILVHDCPHCSTRSVAFPVHYSVQTDSARFNIFSSCPVCTWPISAVVSTNGHDPKNLTVIATGSSSPIRSIQFFPERHTSLAPEDVPEVAADAFIEGAENTKDGRYSSAVMMFRRAIDVGTKVFEPTIDVHNLGKRIDKLEKDGLITKDLKEWAHKIRLEGNEAVHDLPKPTKEQTEELQHFTELVLTYLFTLPAKVRANLPATE
nr:DUF4145 domain-containing protein [Herbaspirillum sp. ASV7]